MIKIIYNFALIFFFLFKPLFVLLNPKFAKREKEWRKVLNDNINKILNRGERKAIWIHSASMGEFEQAKPIIEEFKKLNPNFFIIATFFSPSGYENQKTYPFADVILYLPFDFFWLSKKFVRLLRPDVAIFVRYEFWMNYLEELKKENTPVFLVSATKPFKIRFMLQKKFLKKCLNNFNKIFVVDEDDMDFFKKLNLQVPIEIEYDTRYDRVYTRIQKVENLPLSKKNFVNSLVIVAGSVWEPDLKLIFDAKEILERSIKLKFIYVPHEISKEIIAFIESRDKSCLKFSSLLDAKYPNEELTNLLEGRNILVDKIGHLLSLYSLADVAYVGGGFGKGIHSVIEPAGYFIPIICGGSISNSVDALKMREIGTLWVVKSADEFIEIVLKLRETNFYSDVSKKMKEFFTRRIGSTKRIISEISRYLI